MEGPGVEGCAAAVEGGLDEGLGAEEKASVEREERVSAKGISRCEMNAFFMKVLSDTVAHTVHDVYHVISYTDVVAS